MGRQRQEGREFKASLLSIGNSIRLLVKEIQGLKCLVLAWSLSSAEHLALEDEYVVLSVHTPFFLGLYEGLRAPASVRGEYYTAMKRTQAVRNSGRSPPLPPRGQTLPPQSVQRDALKAQATCEEKPERCLLGGL